ncbi:DMT family transporter [Leeia oryzae]|uniref:DMT family transporter n=1 Tax=Leeia oryzae TaxID=356662 RepID=UPI00035C3728|nr:DMT family transporter [Leeia oryzae]
MDVRKPLDLPAILIMLLLCMIWGFQQITLKASAADITPLLQIALRSGISALLVIGLMIYRHEPLGFFKDTWRPGLLAGVLFALEFLLVGEALRYSSASHVIVFVYTAPIFASLGMQWLLPAERLKPLQWVGILIAFIGIATAFLLRDTPVTPQGNHTLLGDFLGLLAGASWGATTVAVRCTRLAKAPATQTLLYQLLVGLVLLLVAAALLGQLRFNPSPLALASLAFQSVVVSFASFLTWFWLLRKYLASRLGVFSFMTPLFGVMFGVALLHEPLEHGFVIGALLVLAGVILVSGYEWFLQLLGRAPARR